jgi:hypothetical protein
MLYHCLIVTVCVGTVISANAIIREAKETGTYLVGHLIR